MVGGRLLKRVGLEWPRNLCTILKMACALRVRTEEETPDDARRGPDVDLAMALANKELALNCPKKSVEPDGHVSLHRLQNPASKIIVLDSNRRTTHDVVLPCSRRPLLSTWLHQEKIIDTTTYRKSPATENASPSFANQFTT